MAKKETKKVSNEKPDIELNEEQKAALSSLIKWWKTRSSNLFQISGAAGTGKTTLILYLIKEIGLRLDQVLFTAFVGKAALAMRCKGLPATTIHRAIMQVRTTAVLDKYGKKVIRNGSVQYKTKFIPVEHLDDGIKLIVVDEAAMVPTRLARTLMKYRVPIIALGDLNQLPPVSGDSYFLHKPDAVLSQIMRQSSESPIPYLAQGICTYGRNFQLNYGSIMGGKINIISNAELTDDILMNQDIIICHSNRARSQYNQYIREHILEHTQKYPMIGDKLICRRNNWDTCIAVEDDLYYLINGMIGYVTDINLEKLTRDHIPITFHPDFLERGYYEDVNVDIPYLNMSADDKRYYTKNDVMYGTNNDLFEYGYAITCHLAQGSEYNRVLVDLSSVYLRDPEEWKKWFYTAVTRCKDTLTIVA